MGTPQQAAGSPRSDPWVGLGSVFGSATGGFGAGAGGGGGDLATGGGGGGSRNAPPLPGGAGGGGLPGNPPPPATPAAGVRSVEQKRTEFVIVMYWVEPLPTEPPEAKGIDAAAAATTTPTPNQ